MCDSIGILNVCVAPALGTRPLFSQHSGRGWLRPWHFFSTLADTDCAAITPPTSAPRVPFPLVPSPQGPCQGAWSSSSASLTGTRMAVCQGLPCPHPGSGGERCFSTASQISRGHGSSAPLWFLSSGSWVTASGMASAGNGHLFPGPFLSPGYCLIDL